ncbi:hypothetical protein BPNPMPFG_000914 [Mesorhizobium sp. AR07]|uniref:hypothetical protein n=1 Tax=Mesorhizobium sp. AR07 TaxID=2865838 RepID=UPI00215E0ED2|nr:hypothetical protein [Mesorhizobium sp. AR07]UVK45384.1 hypothetical protein BPNPMPFG_000914 [Mesorhizobium sp. AR07]
MNEQRTVQLEPLVVLNQTAQLADLDRATMRNHIMLLAQREHDLGVMATRQAEEVDRLRKALEIALVLPPEDPNEPPEVAALRKLAKSALAPAQQPGAPAEETQPRAEPTEAEQIEALRRHAMGEG